MSKDLLKRGFKFVGPTIVYAFMQATGMVNDHLVSCYCHDSCAGKKRAHDDFAAVARDLIAREGYDPVYGARPL